MRRQIMVTLFVLLILFILFILNLINPLYFYNNFVNNHALSNENPSICRYIIFQTPKIHHAFLSLPIFDSGGWIDQNSCIEDVASKLGDFSICEGFLPSRGNSRVSPLGGELEQCYGSVIISSAYNYNSKAKSVDICLEILKSDYYRSECIEEFAKIRKNDTICNLLSDKTLQELCYQASPNENCNLFNNKSSEKEICINSVNR